MIDEPVRAVIPLLLWNEHEVAQAIGVSAERIQELARNGAIPAFKLGRVWKFDPDTLRDWIKGNGELK